MPFNFRQLQRLYLFMALLWSFLTVFTNTSAAQSLDEDTVEDEAPFSDSSDSATEDDADLPDDFTGTLAEDEDEDNPNFEKRKTEREAFGDEDEEFSDEEGDAEERPDGEPAADYLLKFNFESQVVFSGADGQAYMQINYTTKIEQEVSVVNKRWRGKSDAVFESDIVGNLAGNDLFSCKLDITIDSSPVEIMTRLKHIKETEENPESYEVAVQLDIEKSYKEDWFSNCTGTDGSEFNTKGSPEKYNLTILDNIEPSLNGIVISDFDPSSGGELDLVTEPIDILDEDLGETVTLSGTGTVSIEYLGQ